MITSRPLLTLSEAARELGMSAGALRARVWRGTLPIPVVQGRPGARHYVRRVDLERLLGAQAGDDAA